MPVGDYNGHNEGLKIKKHLKQMYTEILMVTLKAGLQLIFLVCFTFFFFLTQVAYITRRKRKMAYDMKSVVLLFPPPSVFNLMHK